MWSCLHVPSVKAGQFLKAPSLPISPAYKFATSLCLLSPWEPLRCSFTRYIFHYRNNLFQWNWLVCTNLMTRNENLRSVHFLQLHDSIHQSATTPYCINMLDVAWTYRASLPWGVITSWNCQEVSKVPFKYVSEHYKKRTTTNKPFNSKWG